MRKLYLIRHARPDMPLDRRMCLGSTDIPLGTPGKLQSVLLGEHMADRPVAAVFCSDLSRAVQTAQYLAVEPVALSGLREMDAGDWDGLYFDEIRLRWPEIYEQRGIDPGLPIPGSEPAEAGQARFSKTVMDILERQDGDIAIVAHATVIRSFLSLVLGTPVRDCRQYRLEYASVTTLGYADGAFAVLRMNELPRPPLTPQLCGKLMKAAGAPLAHCREVAEKADALCQALADAGIPVRPTLVQQGALLHDIARAEKDHAALGARWLTLLGYPEVAEIVKYHHDPENPELDEKNIVFLADKLPLEARFAASARKCLTQEAVQAHRRRYEAARALKEKINALCGKEIIQ